MNAFTYYAIAYHNRIDLKRAQKALYSSYERGGITYPRTDGRVHPPIKIVDRRKCEPLFLKIYETPPPKKSPFYEIEQLGLSTPSSIVDDVLSAQKLPEVVDIDIKRVAKEMRAKSRVVKIDKIADMDIHLKI